MQKSCTVDWDGDRKRKKENVLLWCTYPLFKETVLQPAFRAIFPSRDFIIFLPVNFTSAIGQLIRWGMDVK